MPIRRELRPLYPPHWRELSHHVRFERAGAQCQRCGRRHLTLVRCLPDGRWFDELVIALFLAGPSQRTLPMQMFVGLREHLDPTITAAATLMMALSILLLIVADRLRR